MIHLKKFSRNLSLKHVCEKGHGEMVEYIVDHVKKFRIYI